MSIVFRLKAKAFKLPNCRSNQTPNCYARITVDGGRSDNTTPVNGSNPEWPECFDISLTASSTITVELFHVTSPSETDLRGTVKFTFGTLPRDHEPICTTRKLRRNLLNLLRIKNAGVVEISLSRKPASADSVSRDIPNSVLGDVDRAADALMKQAPSDLYLTVLKSVEKIMELGQAIAQVHPVAQVAFEALKAAHKVLQSRVDIYEKMLGAFIAMRDMIGFAQDAEAAQKISKLHDIVSSMMVQIRECAEFIQDYASESTPKRLAHMSSSKESIDKFIKTFNTLRENFHYALSIDVHNTVYRLKEDGGPKMDKDSLEELPGWDLKGVRFDESMTCLPGTRTQLLDEIRKWAKSPDEKRILLLSGGAGTGKTSIANSVALEFEKDGRLGASFTFKRDTPGLNIPENLFGNLCYQLAWFKSDGNFRIRHNILEVLRSTGKVLALPLQNQARKLIVETTRAADLAEVRPVVIVIDALDEAGNKAQRKKLLETIGKEFPNLPKSIKVIITSRDENDIRTLLADGSKFVSIDETKNTEEDIGKYIEHRFDNIRRSYPSFSSDWPGAANSRDLRSRAGSLFIWASVACNFIEDPIAQDPHVREPRAGDPHVRDPHSRLLHLLNAESHPEGTATSPLQKLHELYYTILKDAFPSDVHKEDFRYIVGSIIALEAPLTRVELDSLLGLCADNKRYVYSSDIIVSMLRSILRTDPINRAGKDGPLRLLHPSVYEFLTNHVTERFRIDPFKQNQVLVDRCLTVMNGHLRFNICRIPDKSLLNKEIEDLDDRMVRHISDGLRYSCRSIGYHLMKASDPDTTFRGALKTFVSKHLLYWIETMSLLGEVSKAESCLHDLVNWLEKWMADDVHILGLVRDAISFMRNSDQVIRQSALHTYYSALPLTPRTTYLFRNFTKKDPQLPSIISSHPTWPAVPVRIIDAHVGWVHHVAFSKDGTLLASASDDHTVKLWDVRSGQIVREPLKGHKGYVRKVAFSSDAKKLASASYDKTVMLWDLRRDQVTGQVLRGHTDRINGVVFSPNGTRLASASYDGTVRLWDAENGQAVGVPLEGHTRDVGYVVFSPDGSKLASASSDKTIWLWDVENDKATGQALIGHNGSVNCVAFSPNGKMLVSASSDKTLRLWGVDTCRAIGEPLHGHTAKINHVAFSPDGKSLVSASDDTTMRLWKLDENGKTTGKLLEGHTRQVSHAVFSQDGKLVDGKYKLASASYDGTVRLWDTEKCQPIGSLTGHANPVTHVEFSSDGKKLASGSHDNTVRLWDIDGPVIVEDLKGHTSKVSHVVVCRDGKTLASSAEENLWLWVIEGGQVTGKRLKGHNGTIRHIIFSPDGKKLLSESDDKTVRLWDVENHECINEAFNSRAARSHPDGTVLQIHDITDDPWITEKFTTSTDYGTEYRKNLSPVLDSNETEATVYHDGSGWLWRGNARLLWLPNGLRGDCIAFQTPVIVVGSESGAVTIIKMANDV